MLLATIVGAMAITGKSQELGLRFGDAIGNNVAIDGIFTLGQFSRVHADVSFGNNGVGVEALYDFLYKPLEGESFHWYVGAGPYVFLADPFGLGVAGEVGLEYHFNGAPIAIGADWRPAFNIVENTDFYWGGFGFNVRYVFGQ